MITCLTKITNWITSLSRTQPGVDFQNSRAPAMLNYKDMGVKRINDSLYDFCSCSKGKGNVVVIFFHSLELDDSADPKDTYLRTWTFEDDPLKCWPSTMFTKDPVLKKKKIKVRAFATCYDASKYKTSTGGRTDIFLIAEKYVYDVIDKVMNEFEQPANQQIPIILVGHGFGGIVVQELIQHAFNRARTSNGEKARRFLTNLGGIFFYSTPHGSLKKEVYNHIFPPNGELAETGAMISEFNKNLRRSQDDFPKIRNTIHQNYRHHEIMIMSRLEKNATTLGSWTGTLVEEGSARLHTDVTIINDCDHFTICKPVTGEDGFTGDRYQSLRDFIIEIHSRPGPA